MSYVPVPDMADVEILTDGDDHSVAAGLRINGREMLVPDSTVVTVVAGNSTFTTVTLTIFARTVRFVCDEAAS